MTPRQKLEICKQCYDDMSKIDTMSSRPADNRNEIILKRFEWIDKEGPAEVQVATGKDISWILLDNGTVLGAVEAYRGHTLIGAQIIYVKNKDIEYRFTCHPLGIKQALKTDSWNELNILYFEGTMLA